MLGLFSDQTEISSILQKSNIKQKLCSSPLVSRVSDVCPRVNHRVNQVMKIYSGKMQKISRLVGLSNLSFLYSVSRGNQTDPSFTVSLFCCGSAAWCTSPSLLLQDRAESCNLPSSFQEVSLVFPLLQHQVRGSQPARSKALLWFISPDISMCLLRGGKESFFLCHPHFSGDQRLPLWSQSSPGTFCPSKEQMVPSLGSCIHEGVTEAWYGMYMSAIDASSLRCLSLFLNGSPSGKIDYPVKDSFRLCLTDLSSSVWSSLTAAQISYLPGCSYFSCPSLVPAPSHSFQQSGLFLSKE